MPVQTFAKFTGPAQPRRGRIGLRDLDIIETILRYRFCPTSLLVRLVSGNEDVTLRRLRLLWEQGLINRWAFPGIRTHSEFHFYLDNRQALTLLLEHGRLKDIHPQIVEELRGNREKDYAAASLRGQHMQLGFLQHSLMISRLHFMLEMACRASGQRIKLVDFRQGSQLTGHKVDVPKVTASRQGNEYFWQEHDVATERLPVEPDALFTLRFEDRPEPAHFFYEADRGTMNTTDMMKKIRAYYHFIKKRQRHKQAFGVHPIRAVLIETPSEHRGRKLMELVGHPLVVGPTRRSALFWFTISPLFTGVDNSAKAPVARYLTKPEIILDRVWALPDRSLHALGDAENSATAVSAVP